MKTLKAKYGIYCVFNYKGDWFDEPKLDEDLKIYLFK